MFGFIQGVEDSPRYDWKIVESGIKHQKSKLKPNLISLCPSEFRPFTKLLSLMHHWRAGSTHPLAKYTLPINFKVHLNVLDDYKVCVHLETNNCTSQFLETITYLFNKINIKY
jgi:hypothetical protein